MTTLQKKAVAIGAGIMLVVLPLVAFAHDADFNGSGFISTTPGATVHVDLSVNLDDGDGVQAVSYWFDNDSGSAVCTPVAHPVQNTSGSHESGIDTGGFDIVAPNDSVTTTHSLHYQVSDSVTCDPAVTGSTQPDSNSSFSHLKVKVVFTPPPPTPNCSTGIGSPLLVDINQAITNDPDSSVPGPTWAVDNFTRHIQIWAEGSHYCAEADDNGTFTTNGTISPQSGSALPEVITGTFVGGTHGAITGTFNPTSAWGNTGNAPAEDNMSGLTTLWVENYFGGDGSQYAYSPSPADSTGNWGWTYTACGHGQWINQNAGNTGDILLGTDCSVVTATNQSVTTNTNTPVGITLAGTDSVPANTLVFATSSNPANGTLLAGTAPLFTYTPNTDFNGSDSFTFTAGDGSATSTGTVTVTISAPVTTISSNSNSGGGGGGGGGGYTGGCSTYSGGANPWGGTLPCGSAPVSINGGLVLGASTGPECSPLLSSYLGMGKKNNTADVVALQNFLNTQINAGLTVNGIFDEPTMEAVKAFQLQYWQDILSPWKPFGLGDHEATGYVYKTTLREINNLNCSTLDLPIPQLP